MNTPRSRAAQQQQQATLITRDVVVRTGIVDVTVFGGFGMRRLRGSLEDVWQRLHDTEVGFFADGIMTRDACKVGGAAYFWPVERKPETWN